MPDLIPNRFPATVAYDTNTGQTIKNAQADVFAVTDTTFSTPLPLKDMNGVSMAKLVSSNDGIFPPFVIDSVTEYAEANAKSGSFVTPMVSFLGGSGPEGPEGPAGVGIPDASGAVAGQAVVWNGSAAVWAPVAGGSGITGAPTSWPSTFPASPHTHTAADVSNASTVGRNVLTAADQQSARAAIGAGTGNGTSNLAIGTSSTTAAAGNHTHNAASIPFVPSGSITATNMQDAVVQAASSGGGTGTSSVLVVKYASGAYPALPATKPTGVTLIIFKGPVQPTSGNVAGGIPAYVGDGSTQIMADYEYRNLT